MEGKQKLFYLPEPHTDFYFLLSRRKMLGLVGALAVIVLFAIFLWRGTRAALRTQGQFWALSGGGNHQHDWCYRPSSTISVVLG